MLSRKKLALYALVPIVVMAILLTIFRAPGSTVEGFGNTIGVSRNAPYEAFAQALDEYPVEVDGKKFTAGELGLTAKKTESSSSAWAFNNWGRDYSAGIAFDQKKSETALQGLKDYGSPKDASVYYDNGWQTTKAHSGQGLDNDLAAEVHEAMTAGEPKLSLNLTELKPGITTSEARSVSNALNDASLEIKGGDTILATLTGDGLSGMIEVEPTDGTLTIQVDKKAVETFVADHRDGFGAKKSDGKQVVDDDGKNLKTITKSVDGFKPAAEDELSEDLSKELRGMLDTPKGSLDLAGEVDKAKPVKLERSAVVDASDHAAYFYENGKKVKEFPVAVGKQGTETDRGTFKVATQLETQDMGSCDVNGNFVAGGRLDYCTSDVPWISYFNGGEGFHGTYWHNDFGNDSSNVSHGCVNMRISDAKWVYKFLQVGSTVTVRD